MSNPSRAKGTAWESNIVTYLNRYGWPRVERRTQSGAYDRGDIAGLRDVVIEAKDCRTITIPAWVDEAEVEMINANADIAVVWWKRRGHTNPGDGFVTMTGNQFAHILQLLDR